MRLLSEHESSILKGDLNNIKLPDSAVMYLTDGIPNLFKRINVTNSDLYQEEWLYIPTDILHATRQKLIVSSNNNIDKFFLPEPVQGDGFVIYPILIDKQIKIVIVDKSVKKLLLKPNTLDSIVETLQNCTLSKDLRTEHLDMFMQILLESKNSSHDFIRKVFSLIVGEVSGSCAGYYYENNGILKLRMTVGDLERFDLLPSMVSAQVNEKWLTAIERQTSMLPAESMPEEVTLLSVPPVYHFVSSGLKNSFTNNIVCVVCQGSVSSAKLQFIHSITNQLAKLSMMQFEIGSHIKTFYQKNINVTAGEDYDSVLFKELNNLIDKQLIISGVTIVNADRIIKDFNRYSNTLEIEIQSKPELIKFLKEDLDAGNVDKIYDVADDISDEDLKRYFAKHDSKSLLVYKPVCHDVKNELFVISSPFKNTYLFTYHQFLKDAIDAYVICRQVNSMMHQNTVKFQYEKQLNSRVQLLEKLVGGYFHQIFSKLTVVMAEIDKLEHSIDIPNQIESRVLTTEQTQKIKYCTDEISDKIKDLQSILPKHSHEYNDIISCRHLLKILPQYVNGYLKHIEDVKAIKLELEIVDELEHDFNLTGAELIDILLPSLVSILEKCNQNGKIKMFAFNDFKQEGFNYIFKKSMIREDELSEYIEENKNLSCFNVSSERKPTNWIKINITKSSNIFKREKTDKSGLSEMSTNG